MKKASQVSLFRSVSLILPILPCLFTSASWGAQDAGLPGAYLGYSVGARPMAMGRAFTAMADDVHSVYWNPAGLALLKPSQISLLQTRTSGGANLNYFGYAQPLYGWGGIGMAFVRLDSGSIPKTDELNREVGSFRNEERTTMIAYGFDPTLRFSVGGTLHISEQKLDTVSARAFGGSLGVLAKMTESWRVGLSLQNLYAPVFKYSTDEDRFPRIARLGNSYRLFNEMLALNLDLEKALDVPQEIRWRVGAEGSLFGTVKIRAGFDERKEFSMGLGYVLGSYGLDYSLGSRDLGLSHRMGMTFSFGGYEVFVRANPTVFSPAGLNKETTFHIRVAHRRRVHTWRLEVKDQDGEVVRSFRGSGTPPKQLLWDGLAEKRSLVPAGNYDYAMTVTDVMGRSEKTPSRTVRVEYGTPLDSLQISAR